MSLRNRLLGRDWPAFRHGRRAAWRPPARRGVLLVEGLEDRLAPAVVGNLFVVGTTLVYNGNAADNNITVEGSDTAFQLLDSAGTIDSTVPGMSPSALSSGSAVIPSFIQTIAVNGQNGTDVLNLGPLTTSRNLIVAATTIDMTDDVLAGSFTETSPQFTLANELFTNGGPIAGPVTFNGPVNVAGVGAEIDTFSTIDGNVTFNGPVVGSGPLTVDTNDDLGPESTGQGNITAAGPITLGGAAGLTLFGNNISLHQVIDGNGGANISAQGAVNLNGSLITSGLVFLYANQAGIGDAGFTQVSGDIITSSGLVYLQVNSSNGGGTGSATIGGITTGAGGTVFIETNPSLGNGGGGIFGNGPGVLNVNIPGPGGELYLFGGPLGIDLDTSVSRIDFTQPATLPEQDVDISNTGQALTVEPGSSSQGNVNIANNADLAIDSLSSGGNVTLTTTNAGDVDIDSLTADGSPTSAVTINSAGVINGAAITTPNVVLNASTGIGTTSAINLSSITSPVVMLSANTAAGGINLTNGASILQVNQATAGSGDVSIVPDGSNSLTINGNVSTQNGGNITLDGNQDLVFQGGTVATDTGTITLAAGTQITLPANETVATGGDIIIGEDSVNSIIPFDVVEDLAGTVAAGGDITIDGGTDSTLLSVSGTISASGTLTIDTTGSASSSVLLLGGTLASGSGGTTITTSGPTTLIATGTMTSGGPTQIGSASLADSLSMDLGGTIQSSGALTVNGTTTGASVITISGPITSAGTVTIVGNGATTADTLNLFTTASGPITGIAVTVTGGAGPNTLTIDGPITATTGDITITGGADSNSFVIAGPMSAMAGTTTIDGGLGSDQYVITPATASTFTFQNAGAAASIQINTALANIVSAPSVLIAGGTITFVPGLLIWTDTSGTYSVTPTVP